MELDKHFRGDPIYDVVILQQRNRHSLLYSLYFSYHPHRQIIVKEHEGVRICYFGGKAFYKKENASTHTEAEAQADIPGGAESGTKTPQ